MGLFDAISGVFRAGADFVTDFGGGAFTAIDERLRGGVLRTTSQAAPGTRLGAGVANLFGDIAESYLSARAQPTSIPIDPGIYVPVAVPPTGSANATKVTTGGQVRTSASAPEALAAGLTAPTGVQQAGVGGALLDLLPEIGEGVMQAGRNVANAITSVVGQAEQKFGIDIPLLGPTSITDVGITGALQVANVALPGGAPLTSVSGRAALAPTVMNVPRLPAQITFVAPTPSGGSRIVAYRNMGRPILWSGDLAACKRVARARKKVGRARPR